MLGLAEIGLLVLSIGLSILAGKLLGPKLDKTAQDAPTTLATRGSFLPRVIGRRHVGAIFGWAGDRAQVSENDGKLGGFLTPDTEVWRESAWHMLAVGPATVLHQILQDNKVIFAGPITPNSHPSGSSVSLGGEGTFTIYWGEVDQPTNAFLGDGSRVTVTSRWPNCFYVVWTSKRLGPSPVWPTLVYDIEIAPAESHLSNTPAAMDPTFTLDGATEEVLESTNGAEGAGKFTFFLDVSNSFENGGRVRSIGDTGFADQDFTIFKIETRLQGGTPRTDVFPVGGLTGSNGDGDIQAYTEGTDDGYNPAHILAELWFSAWPHGIKQNKAEFDMDSLEDLGTLMVTEEIKGSVIAKDGQNLRSWMASIHQDLGLMLPHNFSTGLLQFVPVRAPTAAVPNLTADILLQLPQAETLHSERASDRVLFTFPDRENNFRAMPIGIDDAGQASFQEYFRARNVPIVTTINFGSANVIAERRSQEELAGAGDQKLVANRGARLLLPGTQITAAGVADVLLITSVTTDPLSGQVTLKCIPDFLGAAKSTFLQNQGLVIDPLAKVEPDPQFQPFEVPEWISGAEQRIILGRLRAHLQITGSAIHISRDDTTFTSKGTDTTIMQGGTLATAIAIDDPWEIDTGPTIDALGPDIASVLDLSADTVSWRNGRQLVAINGEIFFLKTIVSLGGDQYRLDGLIRARYDTRVAAHGIGDEVYILQNDDGLMVGDPLIEPQVTLYTKSQAVGRGLTNLATVPSESIALYGKGIRPVPVEEIRFDTLHPSVPDGVSTHSWTGSIGGDLPATWGYYTPKSPGTGAGFAGAGMPQEGADPEGDFLVEILDSGDVLQRSVTTETNDYIYTEANRVADFSGEPATFKLRITQLRTGLSSDTTVQVFTKV